MPLHLHIDPFAGIAGDMFIGALLDVGLELDALRAALAPLPIDQPYQLTAERTTRHNVGGIDFKVTVLEPPAPGVGVLTATRAATHRHAKHGDIAAMIQRLNTTPRAKDRARKILDALAAAEAEVHQMKVEDVHFHEVGEVDSIIDMLGSAVGLELLGIDTISCGALPISRGFVRCAHGKMPVPAPATAYLLRGTPTFGIDRNVEMITPTGAAIARSLSDSFGPPPPMTLQRVGYGAGDRDDADVPNLLRVFVGLKAEQQNSMT